MNAHLNSKRWCERHWSHKPFAQCKTATRWLEWLLRKLWYQVPISDDKRCAGLNLWFAPPGHFSLSISSLMPRPLVNLAECPIFWFWTPVHGADRHGSYGPHMLLSCNGIDLAPWDKMVHRSLVCTVSLQKFAFITLGFQISSNRNRPSSLHVYLTVFGSGRFMSAISGIIGSKASADCAVLQSAHLLICLADDFPQTSRSTYAQLISSCMEPSSIFIWHSVENICLNFLWLRARIFTLSRASSYNYKRLRIMCRSCLQGIRYFSGRISFGMGHLGHPLGLDQGPRLNVHANFYMHDFFQYTRWNFWNTAFDS